MSVILAVLTSALLASPLLAAPSPNVDGLRLESRSIKNYCSRFEQVCASACDNAGRAAGTKTVCKSGGTNLFDFGCTCADGTNLLATALQQVTGYVADNVTTKGVVTRSSTSTSYTFTNAFTTPIKKTTARSTISSFTATSGTTTAYIYQPSSYAGGDIPARRATTPPFCKAFSSACSAVCKSKKDTASTNSCSKTSHSSYDEYKLQCKCSKSSKQVNEDVLNAFGGSLISPTTTIAQTVRSTSIVSVLETRVKTNTITAPTSTRTSFEGKTTVKAAKVAQVTSQLPLTGRIRIDSSVDKKVLGYFNVPEQPGGNDVDMVTYDADPAYAAPISMILEDSSDKNVWAINWKSAAVNVYVTQYVDPSYSYDEPGSGCSGESIFHWTGGATPFGPLQGEFDYYAPDPLETFTWTFDPTEVNKANPDRKVQVPLRPLWYRSDGSYYRPFAILTPDQTSFRPFYFSDASAASGTCNDGGNVDVTLYFEPDPPTN